MGGTIKVKCKANRPHRPEQPLSERLPQHSRWLHMPPQTQVEQNTTLPPRAQKMMLKTPLTPTKVMLPTALEVIRTPFIGIDLGTTKSCVAIYRHGNVEIITNGHGNRTTPSYVAFTDEGFLVGDDAKNQLSRNPNNTIYGVKRLFGHNFETSPVQPDTNHLPFEVLNDGIKLKIKVQHRGENKTLFPEQISSMVLKQMKEVAEDYLKTVVHKAVVSVPAYFNTYQRQATIDAGAIAGFTELRLINESSAAAITYSLNNKITGVHKILIFSLGGGSFGASIIIIDNGICDVKSTSEDVHLGGEDFDNRLVNHFVQEFKRKYNKDLTSNNRAMMRLRTSCEIAKITLSSSYKASIEIDSIFEGIDFHTSITRARFEDLSNDIFKSIIEPLEKLFSDAKMDKSQVHEIVLVGSSTRIPKIQMILQDFFHDKKLNKSLNPVEAVASGAAIYAAMTYGDKSEELQNLMLLDVTPCSLGFETPEGNMFKMIKRNTPIPERIIVVLTSNPIGHFSHTYHPSLLTSKQRFIKIFEGESGLARDNNILGMLNLADFPPKYDIELTFEVDAGGILKVSALERGTNKTFNMTENNAGFSKKDIERMIKDAQSYSDEIGNQDGTTTAANRLQIYCFNMLSTLENDRIMRKVTNNLKAVIMNKCKEIIYWIDCNQMAMAMDEECELKRKELKSIFNRIIIESYKEVVAGPVAGFSGSHQVIHTAL